tara:strand:+ start:2760 stop:3182 length:423 start_codon:yes stop_codon:yes gene_type:complete
MGKDISRSKNPGLAKMIKSDKGKQAAEKMGFRTDRTVAMKGGRMKKMGGGSAMYSRGYGVDKKSKRKPTELMDRGGMKKGGHAKNTKRENRLEELGRVDAEKAYTKKGKKNLKAEKKRVVRELNKGSRGKAKRGFGKEMR